MNKGERMQESIQLLDCTLRDGGQGLEAINSNGQKTAFFTEENKRDIIEHTKNAGMDIIEIGCMSDSVRDEEKYAIYNNIVDLSKTLPEDRGRECIYTGLYIDPDTPVEAIPKASDDLVEGIRVIMRYSQLQKSVEFCAALAEKGYKVFIQPMLTMRYTDEELSMLVDEANKMGAYALYFVDSFGYMTEDDVDRLFNYYDSSLNKTIKIGFHAHNNMDNAVLNAKYFANIVTDRERIVDACAFGMGQGAGNLQTEVFANYLNKNHHKTYDMNEILEVCDILDKFRIEDDRTWGYTPLRFIPAMHNTAYKYAVAMRSKYHMSLVEINKILENMPQEMRHRYTEENLNLILKEY